MAQVANSSDFKSTSNKSKTGKTLGYSYVGSFSKTEETISRMRTSNRLVEITCKPLSENRTSTDTVSRVLKTTTTAPHTHADTPTYLRNGEGISQIKIEKYPRSRGENVQHH